jgi:hypothetical protein
MLAFGPPKTRAGEHRIVELDGHTVGTLLEHRLTQVAERAVWGSWRVRRWAGQPANI